MPYHTLLTGLADGLQDVVVCCRTWLLLMLQKALPWFRSSIAGSICVHVIVSCNLHLDCVILLFDPMLVSTTVNVAMGWWIVITLLMILQWFDYDVAGLWKDLVHVIILLARLNHGSKLVVLQDQVICQLLVPMMVMLHQCVLCIASSSCDLTCLKWCR